MGEPPPGSPQRADIAASMRSVRTKRELASLFRYLGIRPTRQRGQSFLVDANLLRFMVRAGEVGPEDLALDIGCGTGLLAAHLADAAAKVIGIEIDRGLFAIASRFLEDRANVALIQGDALGSKRTMAPGLVEAVERELATGRFASLRVVSNLPYSVASLVVPNLLESRLPVATMVVTVQKEVADRMAARPATKDYGALSVIVQAHAQVSVLRAVPPAVFWPRPKVQSAIVKVVPEPRRLDAIDDYAAFAALARAAFGHRRKTLANALAASRLVADRAAVEGALAECGIAPGDRAEHVGLQQYIELANRLAKQANRRDHAW